MRFGCCADDPFLDVLLVTVRDKLASFSAQAVSLTLYSLVRIMPSPGREVLDLLSRRALEVVQDFTSQVTSCLLGSAGQG